MYFHCRGPARGLRHREDGGQLDDDRVEASADPEDAREHVQVLHDDPQEGVHEPG